MLNNKIKIALGVVLACITLIYLGYTLRIDRFGRAKISWVDCVKVNGHKYYSEFERTSVENTLIGEKIGEVKFNVSKKVGNPSYKFRNGDATYLEVGTEIYGLKSDNNAIAVKIDRQYYIYKLEK